VHWSQLHSRTVNDVCALTVAAASQTALSLWPIEVSASFRPGNALQGAELATADQDYLHTDPRSLLRTVDTVLQAYESQRGKTSMLGQATELMQPAVIDRMRHIRTLILKQYM
jgi:hypothetical protein